MLYLFYPFIFQASISFGYARSALNAIRQGILSVILYLPASDDPDSLKSILEGAGLETEVEMKGLGEEPGIVEEFIERVEGLLETEI